MSEVRELIDTEVAAVDVRELTDMELDTVCGGVFDFQALIQNIDAHQTANANGGNAR
jgi:hypothetical protein